MAEAEASVAHLSLPGLPVSGVAVQELTPREREVLDLAIAGASNRAIATALRVSITTVKSHVQHILAKLGASNRAQVIARVHGLASDR
ncbi:MAG TPA: helix-turn-helix transcriptional regulator [Solirubrobacteraceae bacterium]|nr:helix-turn-helix transcriptional regulator [Solirubrobacteraceae bacterium]